MTIVEVNADPVAAPQAHYRVLVKAKDGEVARLAFHLAINSVGFWFDPWPNDQYLFTVKLDQRQQLDKALNPASLTLERADKDKEGT